jgi:hypothetical protein
VGVVAVLAGRDLLRRWRSVLVLAVLVGLVGGTVLAASAGARRTATALDRFRDTSAAADIELLGGPTAHEIDALAATPGVEAVGVLRAYGLVLPAAPDLEAIGAPVGSAFGRLVDRPRLVAGRAPDADRPDEIAIGEALAARLHLGLGDTVHAESYSPAQVAAILGAASDVGPFAGPELRLRVVGIERRPLDLADRAASGGLLVLSPAFDHHYAGHIGAFGLRLRVRTTDGSQVPAVIAAAHRSFGERLFTTQGLSVETEGARDAIRVLAVALWSFAAVAAIAGALAAWFVLSWDLLRYQPDQPIYEALGLTRPQRLWVMLSRSAVVAVGGAVLGLVGAALASPLFPLGLAGRAEPARGLHLDVPVLVGGSAIVALVVLGIASLAGLRATAHAERRAEPRRPSRSQAATAHAGLPPAATIGVQMALDDRSDGGSVPVRSAVGAVAAAVAASIAVLLLATNADQLAANPARYGWTWDVEIPDTSANAPCGGAAPDLTTLTALSAIDEVCFVNVEIDGRSVASLSFTTRRGPGIDPTVLEGRPPRGDREVALGTATMAALHKHIGDRVMTRLGGTTLRYEIVGRVVLPSLGDAQPLADGAVFTGPGFAPLYDQSIFSRYFVARTAGHVPPPVLARQVAAVPGLGAPIGPIVPSEIHRIDQVRWLAPSLVVLLTLLALGAAVHALITSGHRRRSEFATLRVLGFARRQVRGSVLAQATTIALAGLAVGLPAGAIVGKAGWRLIAGRLGVSQATSLPPFLFVIAAVAALGVLNIAGALTAARSARSTVADLRAG